ncbi:15258_t:CDS:2 [Dentiscutata erythropus]|uniref:15258_t:CDS:1 n=1 Tax=Dentiscutata erythropus TaxID=1348616 RepID=A0A9N9DCT1_9GLOM|nr:15258_t:CDS:2 [Dentiscutata erythropus]
MNEPRTPTKANEYISSTNVEIVDHTKADDFCTLLWSNVKEPQGWTSLAYFIFLSPIFSTFCAIWIWATFFLAIPTLILPPLGFFWCIWTAWSWRALGRVEILTSQICTKPGQWCKVHPDNKLPPILRVSEEKVGRIRFAVLLCTNKHTWQCFIYFAIIKPVAMIIFLISAVLLVICALPPFTLLGLPFMCIGCKRMGELQVRLTRSFLA